MQIFNDRICLYVDQEVETFFGHLNCLASYQKNKDRIQVRMGQTRGFIDTRVTAKIWLLAVTILVGYSNSCSATITQIHDESLCPSTCWEITGLITQDDLRELPHIAEAMRGTKVTPIFFLNSNGGDVEAAIAIGRQLRKLKAAALTWDDRKCYSSCVFILAGAVQRMLSHSIGIHRPYSSRTDKRDYQAIQLDQRRLAKLAKNYLEEVNVSPSLYDAMVSIPPEKIKILSKAELDSYGLLELDPVFQELVDAAAARKRGLSKLEYIRRKAQVNVTCAGMYEVGRYTGNFDSYRECESAILDPVNLPAYRQR